MRTLIIQLVVGAPLVLMALSARADVVWDETNDGDLSNDRLAPTSIALFPGLNSVAGSMTFTDPEYFTVVVPENHVFSGLTPTHCEGDDSVAFIGMQAGTQMTVPRNTGSDEGLLGWLHFGEFSVNQNILPMMGTRAAGFTPPLPSGTYTFWVQQIDGLLVTFALDFGVTAMSTQPNGDYNNNGIVDAADYTLWRDTLGQMVTAGTGADGDGDGTIDDGDYDFWRSRFGNPVPGDGAGAAHTLQIPEPATVVWGLTGLLLASLTARLPTATRCCQVANPKRLSDSTSQI